VLADFARKRRVARRIVAFDAASEHGHRNAARLERAAVSFPVDPASHPADHYDAG